MKVSGKHYRTLWEADGGVEVIDQTLLPHEFKTTVLRSMEECAHAIKAMLVRGAPLIGATAAYGMVLAMRARTQPIGPLDSACEPCSRPGPRPSTCAGPWSG